MLREDQVSRPNIYQVLRESCVMQGREMPIHDVCRPPVVVSRLLTPHTDILESLTVI